MRKRALVLLAVLLVPYGALAQAGEDAPSGSEHLGPAEAYLRLADTLEGRLPLAVEEGNRSAARSAINDTRELLDEYLRDATHADSYAAALAALDAADDAIRRGALEAAAREALVVPGHLQAGAWRVFGTAFAAGSDREYRPLNVLDASLQREGWGSLMDAYRAWRLDKDNATLHATLLGAHNATGYTGVVWRAALASAALGEPRAGPLAEALGAKARDPAALHDVLASRVGPRNASAVAVEAAIAHLAAVRTLLPLAENRSADASAADPAVRDAFETARRAVEADVGVVEALGNLSARLRASEAADLRPLPRLRLIAGAPEIRPEGVFLPLALHGLDGNPGHLALRLQVQPEGLPIRWLRVDEVAGNPTPTSSGGFLVDVPPGAPDPLHLEVAAGLVPGEYRVSLGGTSVRLADGPDAPVEADRIVVIVPRPAAPPADAHPAGSERVETPGPWALLALAALAVAGVHRRVND